MRVANQSRSPSIASMYVLGLRIGVPIAERFNSGLVLLCALEK